jgi:stage V sporulation protein G
LTKVMSIIHFMADETFFVRSTQREYDSSRM